MYRLIVDAPGQTCNRFFSYLESVSWAIVNKEKVYTIYWDTSIKYYPKLRKNKYISFPLYNRYLISVLGEKRWLYFVERIFNRIKRFLKGEMVNGWGLRECDVFYPQVRTIANQLFLPDKKIMEDVETLFRKKINDGKKIVGVHFRKGDYKEFMGGKFYYEDDVYESFMVQVESLFDREVSFFVCTNGDICSNIFDNHDVFCLKKPTVAHDLYGLTLCDYIIGPPSTFSGWASLVGNVPLRYLYCPDELLRIEDFSPLISNSRFQNGKGIWDEINNHS